MLLESVAMGVLEGPAERPGSASYRHRLTISSTRDVPRVVQAVATAMAAEGYAEKARFGMRLALEEALVNAVKHGNQSDPTKCVRVGYQVTAKAVLVEVEDEGAGFDPDKVPDPCAPENLERPSGRGLLLMRSYMTSVRFNPCGNRVTLYKRRTDGPGNHAADGPA
jgi:serine/threonine-protein kinase RsbW